MRGSSKWWIATVLLVTAGVGAGFSIGLSAAAAIDRSSSKLSPVDFVIVVLGAVAGIWAAAYLAGRLTRGNRRRFLGAGAGGMAGLLVAGGLFVVHTAFLGFLQALLVLLLPGVCAAIGSRMAERMAPAATGRGRGGSPNRGNSGAKGGRGR